MDNINNKRYGLYENRQSLIKQLPLVSPLGVHVLISSYCNFRCFYCKHSQQSINGCVGDTIWLKKQFMDIAMFKKIIANLSEFPQKIKLLQFAWMGEPLLHPDIPQMVSMAKTANVAETVSIVTNGSKLTPELSDKLIDAGLDRLRVSIQGLSELDYKRVAKYNLNYDEFLSNLAYFYKHKKHTKVYIKIMDVMVKNQSEESRFREMYEDICDIINIEHLIPMHKDIDLNNITNEFVFTHMGSKAIENHICSYPFFEIQIGPEGQLFPCCSVERSISDDGVVTTACLGDLNKQSLYEYWNGEKLSEFREMMINHKRDLHPICRSCPLVKYEMAEEDRLDGFEERLKKFY